MPEKYLLDKNTSGDSLGMLSNTGYPVGMLSNTGYPMDMLYNTGYRRTYHKSDKINSGYFETESLASSEDNTFLSVGVNVPADVTDVEEWLLQMVYELGYSSWAELVPYLNLPIKTAMVVEAQMIAGVKSETNMLGILQQAVILSQSSSTSYEPLSPMIFSLKRINRTVSLVTVSLKLFYELD